MEQFEYKILEFKPKSVWSATVDYVAMGEELNNYGRQGWEVVSNVYQPNTATLMLILKRKK